MKNAISGLFSSKKAIVYVVTVIVMAAIIFGGVDPDHASDFVDKLSKLAMAYLGGQGLADLGKYAGEAYSSGQKAIADRDREMDDWETRVAEGVEAGKGAGDKVEDVAEAAEEKAEQDGKLPAPPKVGGSSE